MNCNLLFFIMTYIYNYKLGLCLGHYFHIVKVMGQQEGCGFDPEL